MIKKLLDFFRKTHLGCDILVIFDSGSDRSATYFRIYTNVRNFEIDNNRTLSFEADAKVKKLDTSPKIIHTFGEDAENFARAYYVLHDEAYTHYAMYGFAEYKGDVACDVSLKLPFVPRLDKKLGFAVSLTSDFAEDLMVFDKGAQKL